MDSPRSSLKRVISKVRETPNAWVNVESVTLAPRGIVVALVLQKGRKGRALARWTVACRGVRELKVSDLTGGGIRLYASDHPAARQHAAAFVRLSCPTAGRAGVAWMALATAHRAAVDDWIHFDRYLPATLPQGNTLVVRAPDFLIRHYARALRRIGLLFKQRLAELKDRHPAVIAEVRGEGLLIGLRTVVPNAKLVDALRVEKMLAPAAGDNVVRLLPPLIAGDAEIGEAMARLDRACIAIERELEQPQRQGAAR